MYFNTVSLSPSSVQDILATASYLQIDTHTRDCVTYVKERSVSSLYSVSLYSCTLYCHFNNLIVVNQIWKT
jgi:hypothetical protein